MKVNELSIGDWVCAVGTVINGEERLTPPMQVVRIGETWVCLLIDPEAGDPDEYDIKDIRPVPLTVDILLNNGWNLRDTLYGWTWRFEERLGNNFIRCSVDIQFTNDENTEIANVDAWSFGHLIKIKAQFVHQLQHALRHADIEKEIEL